MPAKKTKSTRKKKTVVKRKTTRKKAPKRVVSSRAKKSSKAGSGSARKPAKKKMVTKKKAIKKPKAKKPASTKKKKPLVKRTPRKKSEQSLAERTITPRVFAADLHSKQAGIERCKPSQLYKKRKSVRKGIMFSFPSALSQVRRSVTESNEPIPTKPLKSTREHLEMSQTPPNRSPYVLDLKRKMTVVDARHQVKLAKKSHGAQPQLDLFDEKPTLLAGGIKRLGRKIKQSLSPQKKINLLPAIKNSGASFSSSARLRKRLAWQVSEFGYLCKRPLHSWKERQLQKKLRLPDSLGMQITPLVKETRGGQAIPVSKLSQTIMRARTSLKIPNIQVVDLSKLVRRQSRRGPSIKPILEQISFRRALVPFVSFCLLLLLPFAGASLLSELQRTQGEVFGATNVAVLQLQEAGEHAKSLQFQEASELFDEAAQGFLAAGALLENQHGLTISILSHVPVVGEKLESAQDLLDVGNELSEAATILSQGVAAFTDEGHFLSDEPASYKLEYLFVRLQEARPYLSSANEKLAGIESDSLPEDVQLQVEQLQKVLPQIDSQFTQFEDLHSALLTFLGHESLERYIVIFQNNTELRATGGFMGSLALVDLDRAEIKNIEIPGGGPYDFQGTLFDDYQAPRALQLINPRWELHDANWFFDWPLSAEKIGSFYEKAGGPSVDGVIAINTNVLESMLDFLGPVYLEDYGVEISSENFRQVLQQHVEFEYDEELNQPKKIIADLAPFILEKIQNLESDQYLELAQHFGGLLASRDILIAQYDEDVHSAFENYGWTGGVVETDEDYLAVVHTNLAGGKTDGVMKDTFDLDIHIDESGETTHTLTIRRDHTGEKGVPLVGVRNVDYQRVYVPNGSELISASGFDRPPLELFEAPNPNWEVDQDLALSERSYAVHQDSGTEIFLESGKTVFANWVQTDPGTTSEIKLVYRVPQALHSYDVPQKEPSWTDWITGATASVEQQIRTYQLYWQKQSGSWSPELSITINYPQQWELETLVDLSATRGTGSWNVEATMKGDSVWRFLFH